VSTLDDGRAVVPKIIMMDQGREPIEFTVYFHGWQYNDTAKVRKYKKQDIVPVEQLVLDVPKRPCTELPLVAEEVTSAGAEDGSQQNSASWAAGLKDLNPDNLVVAWERLLIKPSPKGVDGSRLEAYLEENEFLSRFKMTSSEFYKLPKWKQITVRKDVGLF